MSKGTGNTNEWALIDRRAVESLVQRDGADAVIGALSSDAPSPKQRAVELAELAVAGKVVQMREKTTAFKEWAETQGLRRLNNTLIELDRVLGLDTRGQAILQAQALTRFMAQNVDEDIDALRQAVAAKS